MLNPPDWERRARQAVVVIAIVLAIGTLKLAKSALVPVLFAVFLAMLLSPAVATLRRLRVPRALGAAIVVVSLVAFAGVALRATWEPAREWLDKAPATMKSLERKLRPVTHVIAKVESVSEQADRVTDPAAAKLPRAPPAVVPPAKSPVANGQEWLIAITTTLMVTYFLLAGGPSMLVRLEAAFTARGASSRLPKLVTTITSDVGRYFATVSVSNLMLAIGTTVTMHWLDMPSPLLWGLIAFVLNYVPYAGSATTLVLLTVVALVSFDGLGKAFWVAGCYLVLTGIEGQILQPVLVGRRFEVSPLLVLLALWFGEWLWGIAGVALAVPLLVAGKSLLLELQGPSSREAAAPPQPRPSVYLRAAELLSASRHHRRDQRR